MKYIKLFEKAPELSKEDIINRIEVVLEKAYKGKEDDPIYYDLNMFLHDNKINNAFFERRYTGWHLVGYYFTKSEDPFIDDGYLLDERKLETFDKNFLYNLLLILAGIPELSTILNKDAYVSMNESNRSYVETKLKEYHKLKKQSYELSSKADDILKEIDGMGSEIIDDITLLLTKIAEFYGIDTSISIDLIEELNARNVDILDHLTGKLTLTEEETESELNFETIITGNQDGKTVFMVFGHYSNDEDYQVDRFMGEFDTLSLVKLRDAIVSKISGDVLKKLND